MATDTESLSKATRKKRSESGYSQTGGNIAAIAFGTTFCSLAYSTTRHPITVMQIDHKEQVPNSILIRKNNDGTHTAVAFGLEAAKESFKCSKRLNYQNNYIYFEQLNFEMSLKGDEVSESANVIYSTSHNYTIGKIYLRKY